MDFTLNNIKVFCDPWMKPNHIFFQLANFFLFLSYLSSATLYGLLFLRITLALGTILFAIWGWLILCSADTLAWNTMFAVINIVQLFVILYTIKPSKFNRNLEVVYNKWFKPLHIPKHVFAKIADLAEIPQKLGKGEFYAEEDETKVTHLSMLLDGCIHVKKNGCILYEMTHENFINSPEILCLGANDVHQVSLQAATDCTILNWRRLAIDELREKDTAIGSSLSSIMGQDVALRVLHLNSLLATYVATGPTDSNREQNTNDSKSELIGNTSHGSAAERRRSSKLIISTNGNAANRWADLITKLKDKEHTEQSHSTGVENDGYSTEDVNIIDKNDVEHVENTTDEETNSVLKHLSLNMASEDCAIRNTALPATQPHFISDSYSFRLPENV